MNALKLLLGTVGIQVKNRKPTKISADLNEISTPNLSRYHSPLRLTIIFGLATHGFFSGVLFLSTLFVGITAFNVLAFKSFTCSSNI